MARKEIEQGLFLRANRAGYGPDQIQDTMAVWELIEYLRQFDEDTRVYLAHDGGYTYGGVRPRDFFEGWFDDTGRVEDYNFVEDPYA